MTTVTCWIFSLQSEFLVIFTTSLCGSFATSKTAPCTFETAEQRCKIYIIKEQNFKTLTMKIQCNKTSPVLAPPENMTHFLSVWPDQINWKKPQMKMIRSHSELCCSPSFRLHCADDASLDASDLSALNVLDVQTDNSHSTSVTAVAAKLHHRCDTERSAESLPLCNDKC